MLLQLLDLKDTQVVVGLKFGREGLLDVYDFLTVLLFEAIYLVTMTNLLKL